MNDGNIQTGEYGQFDSAATRVGELSTQLEGHKTKIIGYHDTLNNEAVFAGPLADSALQAFTSLNAMIDKSVTNFSTIKSYVNTSVANYVAADNAAVKYLNIKEDGTLYEGTQVVGNNQAFVDSLYQDLGKKRGDFGFYGAWCAQYVSKKLKDSGYVFTPHAVVDNLMNNLEDAGFTIHTGSDYVAQPGDIVSMDFDNNGVGNHIEIVVKDNGDGTVSTIGGNTTNNYCVAERTRAKNSSDCKILKYATPTKGIES